MSSFHPVIGCYLWFTCYGDFPENMRCLELSDGSRRLLGPLADDNLSYLFSYRVLCLESNEKLKSVASFAVAAF